ncbi:MAG TPA: spherulation-specific family 4 protein, partial [Nitrososphaerales archaeon]|nr:spherulation-specific family 4 protein [Nitrososphaerales archaeon]
MKRIPGLLIPLYIYPGFPWHDVIRTKQNYPAVPFLVVVNPRNGPGAFKDPKYAAGIKDFQSAEITVLGYVFTSYGSRNRNEITQDIDSYSRWYGVDGIMFDEMSLSIESAEYYASLREFSKSRDAPLCLGNPGKALPEGYPLTMDIVNIYEDAGMPPDFTWSTYNSGTKLSMIAHGVEDFGTVNLEKVSGLGYLFLTDGRLPNPYDRLPSYFSKL